MNCDSDARPTRWMRNHEEADNQAKNIWLGKLGCLLKLHGNIEYMFNDPWAYRISDFPRNYKLFSVGRGGKSSRKDHYLCGGEHKFRSPQEFYPHLHWLLDNARGVKKPCLCQYCSGETQDHVNKIFPLPPHRESPPGPKGPKNNNKKAPIKLRQPKGVTTKRGLIYNRNSITTGPVTSLRGNWQEDKFLGYKTSHPFR